jgi:hypothetical protein
MPLNGKRGMSECNAFFAPLSVGGVDICDAEESQGHRIGGFQWPTG